jgi:hypothetical protein
MRRQLTTKEDTKQANMLVKYLLRRIKRLMKGFLKVLASMTSWLLYDYITTL